MHRIRRQILELEFPRERGAAEQARLAGQWFQEKVLPKLELVFNRIAPEGRILRIRRLEIDLGALPGKQYEAAFIERCIQQIISQVEAAAFDVPASGQAAAAEINSPQENAVAIFQFFLEQGTLPWYAKGMLLKDLEKEVTLIIATQPTLFKDPLQYLVLHNQAALQRLIWQFSTGFAVQVLECLQNIPAGSIGQALELLQYRAITPLNPAQKQALLKASIPFSSAQKSAFLKGVIPLSSAQKSTFSIATTPLSPKQKSAFLTAIAQSQMLQIFRQALDLATLSTWLRDHKVWDLEPFINTFSTTETAQIAKEKKAVDYVVSDQEARRSLSKSAETELSKRSRPTVPELEGLLVAHAGLVLLGPYLPAFFGNLGIKIIKDHPESAYRAIHLLHYLAEGTEHPEEPFLALPKILCGLALDEPVPQEFELEEVEKNECNNLLMAVIENWSVLKNTSPAGLQVAFLQREGLLYRPEEQQSWVLRLERQGQDMLLERLPWSYSVLKLDWMDDMIRVEW